MPRAVRVQAFPPLGVLAQQIQHARVVLAAAAQRQQPSEPDLTAARACGQTGQQPFSLTGPALRRQQFGLQSGGRLELGQVAGRTLREPGRLHHVHLAQQSGRPQSQPGRRFPIRVLAGPRPLTRRTDNLSSRLQPFCGPDQPLQGLGAAQVSPSPASATLPAARLSEPPRPAARLPAKRKRATDAGVISR